MMTTTESKAAIFKDDGNLVGLPEILSCPNVSVSEAVNKPVPVPSRYVDERGEIHNLSVGSKRINLLSTKAGVMRSGDIHRDTQHDFIFSGSVQVWILKEDGCTVKKVYNRNSYIAISPFTPHIFEFLEDTVMAEWWDTPFYAWFYDPYRAIVKESFQSTQPGRFSLYEVTDKTSSVSTQKLWLGTALAVGLSLGYALGRGKDER